MKIEDMIAVLQAAKAGKAIECRAKDAFGCSWTSAHNPLWLFGTYDYRVKPEPRVIWINEYDGELGVAVWSDLCSAQCNAAGFASARQVRFIEDTSANDGGHA